MLKFEVTADWQGRPLSALSDLIALRQRVLGEDARDAVVATAIDVVTSLRALTRKAPRSANRSSFVVEETPYVASWERAGGRFRRVARVGGTGAKASIFPVNNAGQHYFKGERVRIWRVVPAHPEKMTWEKNRNKGCWYVFARNKAAASRFAQAHMSRVLRKESGMAKTALGFAMAYLSTRSAPVEATGAKAQRIASEAIRVSASGGSGDFSLQVLDTLEYAKPALKGGESAISLAMMKAANKIAGRLAKWQESHFFDGDRVQTPFPEIARSRR